MVAINAVSQLRSKEFLTSYANLKAVYKTKKMSDKVEFINDLNFVIGIYENISLLYLKELADHSIIESSILSQVNEISQMVDSLDYPNEYREHFNKLLKVISKN
jgi:hypothetical protein